MTRSFSPCLFVAFLLIFLVSCSFEGLSTNPPPGSRAGLSRLSLPSLTITGIIRHPDDEGRQELAGTLAVRAHEDSDDNSGYPVLPSGPVLQEMPVGYRVHGQSSQAWPKKSWTLELRDPENPDQAKSVAFLGFPKDNDFVFHSIFSDKSLLRNLMAYRLGGEIMDWAPRTRLVEIWAAQTDAAVLDTVYQGIYLVCEKIKVSSDRVPVTSMTILDNAEPEVTGGYLFRIDWSSGNDWQVGTKTRNLAVVEPDAAHVTDPQRAWVTDFFTRLEASFRSTPVGDWRQYVDEASFMDYMILNELYMNVDAYRLSTWMHLDRGGKLKAGPVWDFDLGSGNDYRSANFYTDSLSARDNWEILSQLDPGFTDQYPAFWWSEMLHDPKFRQDLRARWKSLRQDKLSDAKLNAMMDSAINEARPAIARNFIRWPSLAANGIDDTFWTPLWAMTADPAITNPVSAFTFEDHLTWFKDWTAKRLAWLDSDAAWQAIDDWAASSALHLDQGGNL